jgi:DNA-binding transcriptional regulator YiaG
METQDVLLLRAARTYAATGTGQDIRRAALLSLNEMAAAVGVAPPVLSRWENGLRRPRNSPAAIRWAALLNALAEPPPNATAKVAV